MTPEILWPATRQFRHNNSDGFVMGFDCDLVKEIVKNLTTQLEAEKTKFLKAKKIITKIHYYENDSQYKDRGRVCEHRKMVESVFGMAGNFLQEEGE